MNSSRLELLPENRLERELLGLQRREQEFNHRQPISGRSGVLAYLTKTNNTWDYEQTLVDSVDGVNHKLLVTFTGDGSQKWPIERVFADLFFNGTAESNRPTYDEVGRLRWQEGSAAATFISSLGGPTTDAYGGVQLTHAESEYVSSWIFDFNISGTVTVRMKAYCVGTSPGTVTVQKVTA